MDPVALNSSQKVSGDTISVTPFLFLGFLPESAILFPSWPAALAGAPDFFIIAHQKVACNYRMLI
jgi:hypothetical protein